MTAEYCLKILCEIKDVAFATVDEKGDPQVRIIDVMLVEDGKLYFCTSRGKDFYAQLIQSGKTAITGLNEKYQMVRLNGTVVKINKQEQKRWIDRIFMQNPSMNDVYQGESRYILEAFFIEDGLIEFFDLGKTPVYRELLSMGASKRMEKGFYITLSCVECGECIRCCPQQCIEEGQPYQIRQENCLHCGLCYENCSAGAIKRKDKS